MIEYREIRLDVDWMNLILNDHWTKNQIRVFLSLYMHNFQKNGERSNVVYPALRTISKYTNIKVQHIVRTINQLKEKSVIKISKGAKKFHNIYEIIWPELSEKTIDKIEAGKSPSFCQLKPADVKTLCLGESINITQYRIFFAWMINFPNTYKKGNWTMPKLSKLGKRIFKSRYSNEKLIKNIIELPGLLSIQAEVTEKIFNKILQIPEVRAYIERPREEARKNRAEREAEKLKKLNQEIKEEEAKKESSKGIQEPEMKKNKNSKFAEIRKRYNQNNEDNEDDKKDRLKNNRLLQLRNKRREEKQLENRDRLKKLEQKDFDSKRIEPHLVYCPLG